MAKNNTLKEKERKIEKEEIIRQGGETKYIKTM
jgi:hypothetical protein